jgi:hypothetical protein
MLLRLVLAAALLSTSAYAADYNAVQLAPSSDQSRLTEDELSQIRGSGLPIVGTSLEQSAADANIIVIGEVGVRSVNTVQELTDNWNLQVGVPLIAAAASRNG